MALFVWQLLLFSPYLLILGLLARFAWSVFLIYRDVDQRRPRDVSGEGHPLPPNVAAWASELRSLGFERFGEAELILPATGLFAPFFTRSRRHHDWLMVDGSATTVAALAQGLAEFSSRLTDGSYVVTMHPRGETIDEPQLLVSRVFRGLAEAYRRHVSVVESRATEHGPARRLAGMADWISVHDRDFRRQHAKRLLRRPLIVNAMLPLALSAAALTVLAIMTLPAIEIIARALVGP